MPGVALPTRDLLPWICSHEIRIAIADLRYGGARTIPLDVLGRGDDQCRGRLYGRRGDSAAAVPAAWLERHDAGQRDHRQRLHRSFPAARVFAAAVVRELHRPIATNNLQ